MFFIQQTRYGEVRRVPAPASAWIARQFDLWWADYLAGPAVTCDDLLIIYVGF